MKYSRRRYAFVPALLSAALLVSAYPGAALADGETGVYLDGAQAESYDAALAAAAADPAEHTVTVYSDAETAVRNEFVTGNTVTIRNGDNKATVTQTGQNNISLLIASGQEPTVNLGKEELEATGEETALVFNAGANRSFMELNGGTVNLYNGTVITGGTAARGGGFDAKNNSVLNIYGGKITGGTATGTLGGGGVAVVGNATVNMYGGEITGNSSAESAGGGVSVAETNSEFHMYGGTVSGNDGYDVYVGRGNFYMSGTAYAGEVYLPSDKVINVEGEFDAEGPHAVIEPETYASGQTVAVYADGITPDASDFSLTNEEYSLTADGQSLKLTTELEEYIVASVTYGGETTEYSSLATAIANCPDGGIVTVLEDTQLASAGIRDKSIVITTGDNDVTVTKTPGSSGAMFTTLAKTAGGKTSAIEFRRGGGTLTLSGGGAVRYHSSCAVTARLRMP